MLTVPRRHAVLCPFAVRTWGHVMRTLSLADALAERGYRITFATARDVESRVVASGYPFVEHPNMRDQTLLRQRTDATIREFGDELARSRRLLRDLAADVVITDLMPVVNVGAALECVPSISMLNLELVPAPLVWWHEGLQFVFAELGIPAWAARRIYGDALIVADGADALGLRELAPAQAAEITSSVREIRFVGPMQPASTNRWTHVPRARRRVVISLGGGQAKLLEQVLQQCLEVEADLIVVAGAAVAERVHPIVSRLRATRTVEVVEFMPQFADALCEADALITHGGHGTLVQALSLGVPTLAVPDSVEREINAARLRGVGEIVVPTVAGLALAPALARLLDDRARDGERRRIAEALASYGGVAAAAQLVDRVAGARLPEAGPP